MSNILSDPLFVRAEVEYRLERYGARGAGTTASWPDLSRRLRHWITEHRHVRPVRDRRPVLVPSRPRHP